MQNRITALPSRSKQLAILSRNGALPLAELAEQIRAAGREVSSGTLSNTLQTMKKRGAVKNGGGKWMLPKNAHSARPRLKDASLDYGISSAQVRLVHFNVRMRLGSRRPQMKSTKPRALPNRRPRRSTQGSGENDLRMFAPTLRTICCKARPERCVPLRQR